jgi:hypothetical protein
MYRDNANRRIPVSLKYPLGIELGSLMTGSKPVVHWTSETWCECSEIAVILQALHNAAIFHEYGKLGI